MGFSVGKLRVALLRIGLEHSQITEERARFAVVFKTKSLLMNISIPAIFCRLLR